MKRLLHGTHELLILGIALAVGIAGWMLMATFALMIGEWLRTL